MNYVEKKEGHGDFLSLDDQGRAVWVSVEIWRMSGIYLDDLLWKINARRRDVLEPGKTWCNKGIRSSDGWGQVSKGNSDTSWCSRENEGHNLPDSYMAG